jgi:hypothetical protein
MYVLHQRCTCTPTSSFTVIDHGYLDFQAQLRGQILVLQVQLGRQSLILQITAVFLA